MNPKPKPCSGCRAPVLLVLKAEGPQGGRSKWVVLDAELLNPNRQHDGRWLRIVDAGRAFTLQHAYEHVRLGAEDLLRPSDVTRVEDLQWHRVHDCPNRR